MSGQASATAVLPVEGSSYIKAGNVPDEVSVSVLPKPFSSADRSLTMDEVMGSAAVPGESDSLTLAALVSGSPKRVPMSASDSALLAQTFKKLLSAAGDKSSAWTNRGVQDDVSIMSRAPEPGSSMRSFKGFGLVSATADKILRVVLDLAGQGNWDPLFRCGTIVETYDESTDLRYAVWQTPQCPPKTGRNVVYLRGTKCLPDGTCIVAAISRERSDLPVFKGSVRGQVEASGWVIQPFNDKPKCVVTFVCSVDLAGMSSTLVNLVASKQPLVVAGVRKVLTGTRDHREDSLDRSHGMG